MILVTKRKKKKKKKMKYVGLSASRNEHSTLKADHHQAFHHQAFQAVGRRSSSRGYSKKSEHIYYIELGGIRKLPGHMVLMCNICFPCLENNT